jgi:hypothetical protein
MEDCLSPGGRVECRAEIGEFDLVDIHPDDRHPRPRIDCLDFNFAIDERAVIRVTDDDIKMLDVIAIDESVD